MLDKRDGEEAHEVREVLLVEDNLIDAQLVRRLLRRVTENYYRITHVRTLNDAVLGSLDYEADGYAVEDLVRVDVLLHGDPVDARQIDQDARTLIFDQRMELISRRISH